MGSRGASAGSSKGNAIASATRTANKAVDAFLSRNGGMASDGEINGVYEEAFIQEARQLGATDAQINNALNTNLRTTDINYTKGNERAKSMAREQRIDEIIRRLDTDDFKSAAERDKLRAEYSRLNSERSAATLRRFNRRNNIKDVWQ